MRDSLFFRAAVCAALLFSLSAVGFSQKRAVRKAVKKPTVQKRATDLPKVTQIDIEGLRQLIKPDGKPLLINFWATWCDPCRDEFPDLVKLNVAYKGKVDFVAVSLDDLAEINRDVPIFLAQNKAEMPAYLLKTPDEGEAISLASKDWQGNLPLTVLFAADGRVAYERMGRLKYDLALAEIEKVLNDNGIRLPPPPTATKP